jgi:hypothetical protein
MNNLQRYLDQRFNWHRKDEDKIAVNDLDANQAQKIFDSIDCDLSPENLHCDGEISNAEANRKYKHFIKAGRDLVLLGYRSKSTCSNFTRDNIINLF